MTKTSAKVIRFPRVPVPKPTRPHTTKHKTLDRKVKHKAPAIPYDNDERCHGCGADLATAGIANNGCRICSPFMYEMWDD